MPNRFASGKYAIAECDRCAQRYMLKELKTQTVKTKPFKIKV
jgi:PHP family Zn ribbon phosphoesterase